MTRLISEWLSDNEEIIKRKEAELKAKTGLDYTSLSAKASGCSAYDINRAAQAVKVAVVPVTAGQGEIGTFSQMVAAIVSVMGFQSFVTKNTDVEGLFEAYQSEADLLYLADDNRFLAINFHKNKVVDNNIATVAGYIAALEGIIGTMAGKQILLLGYGTLGKEFLKRMKKKGADVTVYDIDPVKQMQLEKEDVKIITQQNEIADYKLIVDATCQGDWLHQELLHPDVWIVTPGVPLSLDQKASEMFSERVVHDCLDIGVATMLGMAL